MIRPVPLGCLVDRSLRHLPHFFDKIIAPRAN